MNKNVNEFALHANHVQLCHWCFCVPATEQMWWKWKPNKPSGVSDPVATEMRRIFKEEGPLPICTGAHLPSRGVLYPTEEKTVKHNCSIVDNVLHVRTEFTSGDGHPEPSEVDSLRHPDFETLLVHLGVAQHSCRLDHDCCYNFDLGIAQEEGLQFFQSEKRRQHFVRKHASALNNKNDHTHWRDLFLHARPLLQESGRMLPENRVISESRTTETNDERTEKNYLIQCLTKQVLYSQNIDFFLEGIVL